jgi:hypothetical protein
VGRKEKEWVSVFQAAAGPEYSHGVPFDGAFHGALTLPIRLGHNVAALSARSKGIRRPAKCAGRACSTSRIAVRTAPVFLGQRHPDLLLFTAIGAAPGGRQTSAIPAGGHHCR